MFRGRRSIRRRLLGMAVTAGAAWLFDPTHGAGRRAQLKEQVSGKMSQLQGRTASAQPVAASDPMTTVPGG